MINQITETVDDLIDHFETEWSPHATATIGTTLKRFQLADDEVALTELIRIDIERRYGSGLPCRLKDYFTQFPILHQYPERAVEIAYEDYRVSIQLGHSIPPQRYRFIPGIKTQLWHQQFQEDVREHELSRSRSPGKPRASISAGTGRDVDESTRLLLRQIGFEPVQRIGVGAFSQVFLAQQIDLASRYVVLKVVRQPRGEPQMMAMLQHTNIVPIYSFHFVDGYTIICMPYAGGVTLNDYLLDPVRDRSRDGESLIQTIREDRDDTITSSDNVDRARSLSDDAAQCRGLSDDVATPLQRLRRLNKEQLAVWMFERLAGALSHSHARGVLHGDLKPANVLIRNDGEPALMDFNLSRSLRRTSGAIVGGTLAYMSPENLRQMMQGTDTDDERSDIYSLGMMLFELLTGSLPFPRPLSQADTDIEAAINVRQQPVVCSIEYCVSDGLWSIVQKCLQYEPSRRYQSADQLQEDLLRESQSRSLLYAQEASSAKVAKWVRRHPRSTSAAAVSVLATVVIIPLIWVALGWRSTMIRAESTAGFNAFFEESNGSLLTMMADPQRYEVSSVQGLLLPLEKHRLLDRQVIDALICPDDLERASIDHRRNVLLRHLVSTAVAECERLRRSYEPAKSLNTLTRLIETAKYVQGSTGSRAITFLEAKLAESNGNSERSIALYQNAVEIPISSDNEYFLEAVRQMADRKWSIARDMLGALADRDAVPTSLRWTTLGRTQLQLGEYENAKLSFTQSIERAPRASRLWLLRASCCGKLGELSRAESDIKQAMALDPSLVETNYNLAMIYLRTGRVKEAIDLLTIGLSHDPDQFPLLILRSRAHRRLGNLSDAERDRERAMSLENLRRNALVLRANTKLNDAVPDFEGALADLEEADRLAPGTPTILQQMAYIYVKLGKADTAIKLLNEVRDREPDNEKAIVYLAVLLARQGEYSQAIEQLNLALDEPNKSSVLYQAACVHALLPDEKSHVQALRYLSSAIQRGYGAATITDDQDLDSLRSMPGFQAILRTTRLGRPPVQDNELSSDPIDEFSTSEL